MPIRVLLVDDHGIMRDGIKTSLPFTEMQVTAEAHSAQSLFKILDRNIPFDVMILDYDLPDLHAIDSLSEVFKRRRDAKVISLVPTLSEDALLPSARSGVRGIVSKTDAIEYLVAAIKNVHKGTVHFTPQINEKLIALIRHGPQQPVNHSLSRREIQVGRLITSGKSSKEIAALMSLEATTVRGYRKTLMQKLNVYNVAQLITKLIDLKIVVNSSIRREDECNDPIPRC
jgi:DNA-binding NarL/FixJ family response regulator